MRPPRAFGVDGADAGRGSRLRSTRTGPRIKDPTAFVPSEVEGRARRLPRLLLALTPLALAACNLQPLYSGGGNGAVARSFSGIEVGPIAGQNGWLMRNALNDRLHASGQGPARYRLEVELQDRIIGFGVRADNGVTRERRTLRARYRLVEAGRGTVVLDATAGADAGIDVVSSEYAVVAAEQTALERLSQDLADQIVARVALYARRTAAADGPAAPPK